MKKLEGLYILNRNEAAMDLDEQVTEEMQRLQTDAALELCYVTLYKIGSGKIKIAFNNVRSLHKHFKDIEFELNVLAADVIVFAESRLCKRDENVHFTLKRFRRIRLDDTKKESVNRPHHGLALYVKEYFHVQKVVKCIASHVNSFWLPCTAFRKGTFKLLYCTNTQKVHRLILKMTFAVI